MLAQKLMSRLCQCKRHVYCMQQNQLSTSLLSLAGSKYRLRNNQAADALAYGPLTDLPDWTYVDNKPTYITRKRQIRQMERVKMASQIYNLTKEIDKQKHANKDNID
ncbi:39S ribosomal protein L52, mitochondrial-like [Hydractinia symbiolongicarpus]|uniref:39S ribosomal protein L52, mitochondrial-like n=1 Tax=Hydractinia symbiolongicarpus TaxID=13093 RepID=UPI00254BF0A3|nr:39S ribosomal protein L52, mitochondrial-like [Hydractinia symbiolongicarpus]